MESGWLSDVVTLVLSAIHGNTAMKRLFFQIFDLVHVYTHTFTYVDSATNSDFKQKNMLYVGTWYGYKKSSDTSYNFLLQ